MMKRDLNVKLLIVMALSLLVMLGCVAKGMSDKAYDTIKNEYIEEIIDFIFSYDSEDENIDVDNRGAEILEEVVGRHKFTVDEFFEKAEELGEDSETIWDEIDARLTAKFREYIEQNYDIDFSDFDEEE
ncbi:MAG: hypothetical protein WCX83_04120 [Candidatus Cloacimonas sp.]|nr:hypothetical protein [Candidatus Cloacimonadota bacterium]